MSPRPVLSKRDMVTRYRMGEFGNHSPTWNTPDEYWEYHKKRTQSLPLRWPRGGRLLPLYDGGARALMSGRKPCLAAPDKLAATTLHHWLPDSPVVLWTDRATHTLFICCVASLIALRGHLKSGRV